MHLTENEIIRLVKRLYSHITLLTHVNEQIGLKGEALDIHSTSGSSSVEWVEGSSVAQKQPLTWYKVRFVLLF